MEVEVARLDEVDAVVSRASLLSRLFTGVRAIVVVGSYAYGRPTMDSDVDLVVAVDDRDAWLDQDSWVGHVMGGPYRVVREQDWGPLLERRCRSGSGFEVELGVVTPEWFALPVDPGTARVLRDGCRVVTDVDGLVRNALYALALPTRDWQGSREASGGTAGSADQEDGERDQADHDDHHPQHGR